MVKNWKQKEKKGHDLRSGQLQYILIIFFRDCIITLSPFSRHILSTEPKHFDTHQSHHRSSLQMPFHDNMYNLPDHHPNINSQYSHTP